MVRAQRSDHSGSTSLLAVYGRGVYTGAGVTALRSRGTCHGERSDEQEVCFRF